MGISERKERDKQGMRKLILDTAMGLFLEEGFGTVSLRRIAEKIEYSPATIYLYFKDKDEILYALHTAGFDELYRRQQEVSGIRDPWKRFLKHGEVYIRFALENPEYYNLMFIMRAPARKFSNGEEWMVGRRSYEFFREEVARAIGEGVQPPGDPDVATFGLWSLAHGIVALILRQRCVMLDAATIEATAQSAFAYVAQHVHYGSKGHKSSHHGAE
jgi:AcrR family transcriptional regulator